MAFFLGSQDQGRHAGISPDSMNYSYRPGKLKKVRTINS
jgi:hypothetical protein